MKKLFYLVVILSLFLTTVPANNIVAQASPPAEGNSGAVVCSPDVYLQAPDDCLPLGPSEYLTGMARMGIHLPIEPLPAVNPDPSLSDIPFLYYKVDNTTGTSFYPSLDDAMNKVGADRTLARGHLLYVTYSYAEKTDHGTYFALPSGEWMPGDGSRVGVGPIFQGLEFLSTPQNGFGWVVTEAAVRSIPSLALNDVVDTLQRYDFVQVYSKQNIEGVDWYLIGPNRWVQTRFIAAVLPDTTPPAGVSNGRWIDVNLETQTLSVYDKNQLVFATMIASGVEPFWTRPGLFQIYEKKDTETMSGAFEADRSDYYYLEDVPWTMYFDKARALHGAYWNPILGYPQSHGCVNMSIGDAHWLYNWAHVGDWVYVHDPSGKTPTDPAIYGDGGA